MWFTDHLKVLCRQDVCVGIQDLTVIVWIQHCAWNISHYIWYVEEYATV